MNELDLMNITYYPSLEEVENKNDYVNIPLSKLASLGMIGSLFVEQTQTVTTTLNTEGLFSAVIPKGMHLASAKDGSGNLGALLDANNKLAGQARFKEVSGINATQTITAPINPAIAAMSLMLLSIDKKLDTIQESQKEIISLIKTKEHGDIKGNIQYLYDILKDLKNHFTDEQYKKEYRLKIHDIIQDSYKYIETYKERLSEAIKKNRRFRISLEIDKEVKSLVEDFSYYRLSIFMFTYAHYLEVLLGSRIDEGIIQNELKRLDSVKLQYRKIYTDLYNYLEGLYKSSIDRQAVNVLGSASEELGKMINKVPLLEKAPLDEAFVNLGQNLQKSNDKVLVKSLENLRNYKQLNVDGFEKQYQSLAYMYSGENQIFFDKENLYVSERCLV